jgi:uncharacterized membrane protein YphA (DoxX/SURF4 family)
MTDTTEPEPTAEGPAPEVDLPEPVPEELAPEPDAEEPAPEPVAEEPAWRADLRDTRTWGLLAVRGFLALVFFQAALDHVATPAAVLVGQWTPPASFGGLGHAVLSDPGPFVGAVIGLEVALALAMVFGLATRLAGLGGFVLNLFFFLAFEGSYVGQLYLSWDAALALLWLVVLLTGPGRYLGLGRWLADRYPRAGPFLV